MTDAELKENDLLLVTKIARITGKSRSTIYKVLKEELGYVSNRLIKPEEVDESN
jgi:predicted DNA-binding transcriptional regulator AlpA